MQHESEAVTKKSDIVRFTILPDKMRGISYNKETFSADVTEFTHSGKTRWGLVFYGVKSKLIAYHTFVLKEPTSS